MKGGGGGREQLYTYLECHQMEDMFSIVVIAEESVVITSSGQAS